MGIAQEKMQTLDDFWNLAAFLVERQEFDDKAWAKVMGDGAPERLGAAREALEAAEPFDTESVEAALRGVVERLGVKPKEVFQPVRVAISGTTVSPGIFESVAVLGREETLSRIDLALERVQDSTALVHLPIPSPGSQVEAAMTAHTVPSDTWGRRPSEGHGRRLTAAFDALEAFPALAESRNRVLVGRARRQPQHRGRRGGRRIRLLAGHHRPAHGQPPAAAASGARSPASPRRSRR